MCKGGGGLSWAGGGGGGVGGVVWAEGMGVPNYELAKKDTRTIFILLTDFTLVLEDQNNSWGATYWNSSE